MKLENVTENQTTHSMPNGNEDHENGIKDDVKAILLSKEGITTNSVGKRKDKQTKGLESGNRMTGLSYKGKVNDKFYIFQEFGSSSSIK